MKIATFDVDGGRLSLPADLLHPSMKTRLLGAGVDRAVRGREKASHHAPTWIEVADDGIRPTRSRKRRG